jgi:hypothetical protein
MVHIEKMVMENVHNGPERIVKRILELVEPYMAACYAMLSKHLCCC